MSRNGIGGDTASSVKPQVDLTSTRCGGQTDATVRWSAHLSIAEDTRREGGGREERDEEDDAAAVWRRRWKARSRRYARWSLTSRAGDLLDYATSLRDRYSCLRPGQIVRTSFTERSSSCSLIAGMESLGARLQMNRSGRVRGNNTIRWPDAHRALRLRCSVSRWRSNPIKLSRDSLQRNNDLLKNQRL